MKIVTTVAVVAQILAVSAAATQAQDGSPAKTDAAPFGLEWLASSEEVAGLGVTLSPVENSNYGETYSATNLPKALSDINFAFLSFGYDGRLWRVAALSNEFDRDKYGSAAKARYDQLASSLSKSYELDGTFHRASTDSFYGAPDNFAYAISSNEAHWYSVYSSPSADIELSIGSDHEDTFWRLIYSHRDGAGNFEAGKAQSEMDAL